MTLSEAAKRIATEFKLPDERVRKIVAEFIAELKEGLEKDDTKISQIPSYVTAVPNGTEKGIYLAVDLGGTNLRVCSVQLNGDTTFNLIQSKAFIPRELMIARAAKQLFSFLAKRIELFLKENHGERFAAYIRRRQTISTLEGYRDESVFGLGFTFSFPVRQSGINRGTLMRWTKGFDIPGTIDQDVCSLLQKEIDILGLPVKVVALVNDTVGTLMARSYALSGKTNCIMGAIFGTGTNGAYVEKLSALSKPLEGDFDKSTGKMVINTEWGSFDNDLKVLPSTIYDVVLDNNSNNPGVQMFEKRISGMFLGEILRITLLSLMEDPSVSIFQDDSVSKDYDSSNSLGSQVPLFQQWGVDSYILSVAEADKSVDLQVLRQEIKSSLGVSAVGIEDAQAVKMISNSIAKRAARLAGAAIAAIIIHTGHLTQSVGASCILSAKETTSNIGNLNGTFASSVNLKQPADTASEVFDDYEFIDIGVDGSLIEFYPGFENYMREVFRAVDEVGALGDKRIRIGIAKDGGGVGAALIARLAVGFGQNDLPDRYIGWSEPEWAGREVT